AVKAQHQKRIKEEVEMLKQYQRRVNESNQSTKKDQAPKLDDIKRDKTSELDDIEKNQAPDNKRLE
ncbi:16315_t:CDS:1, partial [Racocetra persica]